MTISLFSDIVHSMFMETISVGINPLRLGELGIKALVWYGNNGQGQYAENNKVQLYDKVADKFTNRTGIAHVLAGRIGFYEKVLEIAAGTGLVSSVLQTRVRNGVFMDLSAPALEILRSRIPERRAHIIRGNFLKNPFAEKSFDTIVCVGGYRYVPFHEKDIFWNETLRVLNDGGKLLFAQFKPRFIPINGTTLKDDLTPYGLETVRVDYFSSLIKAGRFTFKTGTYVVAEYKKSS